MKYISFVVPCFNSEAYMEKCIDSLLLGKDDIEIIIIDDGSTDSTGKIADNYQKKYPNIVKAIHQKNGGHGEGINTGLKHAIGKYFKVVDSDDWVDPKAYKELLKKIKKIDSDLIVTNYVYSFNGVRKDQTINFSNVFKSDNEITWDETGKWKITQYPSLHSLMYKKSVLDQAKIKLPKHVFYEDNLFIYLPLPYTKTIYYLDIDFYRYFIGRPDQSVQNCQQISRSMNHVTIAEEVVTKYDLDKIENKKLRKVMLRECIFLMTIATVFSRLSKTKEGEKQYKDLWRRVKKANPKLYKEMRRFTIALGVSLPTPVGRFIALKGYNFSHCLVKFN
ncbi:MAG: glycosyltransferase [Erysipelotrichales bacterium]|nr:glycosyltransferase [Erysipelotrichales bacterium]